MMKDNYNTHLYTDDLCLKGFLCRELYILFYIKICVINFVFVGSIKNKNNRYFILQVFNQVMVFIR